MPERLTIDVPEGPELEIEPLESLGDGGRRVELDVVDGPRWWIDVTPTGRLDEVVSSWDADGQLAEVAVPDWLDDVLLQLQAVA